MAEGTRAMNSEHETFCERKMECCLRGTPICLHVSLLCGGLSQQSPQGGVPSALPLLITVSDCSHTEAESPQSKIQDKRPSKSVRSLCAPAESMKGLAEGRWEGVMQGCAACHAPVRLSLWGQHIMKVSGFLDQCARAVFTPASKRC